MLKKSLITAFAVLAPLAMTAMADWPDPTSIDKYVQMPDMSETGIDVRVDQNGGPLTLADDFPCDMTGPITDVHLWGSWRDDIHPAEGKINMIRLSIHPDDRSNPDYSQPGDEVWHGWVYPETGFPVDPNPDDVGTFRPLVHWGTVDPNEWFWDPRDPEVFDPEKEVWQVNINIEQDKAFMQEGDASNPLIYWLDVRVYTDATFNDFGWKTRDPNEGQYEDDAVYSLDDGVSWTPMVYPAVEPWLSKGLAGESFDLAFAITTIPEPATIGLLMLGSLGLAALKRRRK